MTGTKDEIIDFGELGEGVGIVERDSTSSDVKAGDQVSFTWLSEEEEAAMRDGTLPADTLLLAQLGWAVHTDGSVDHGITIVERLSAMPDGVMWPARVFCLERLLV